LRNPGIGKHLYHLVAPGLAGQAEGRPAVFGCMRPSAPAESSAFTASACPFNAAIIKGVMPLFAAALTFALLSILHFESRHLIRLVNVGRYRP